MRNVPVQILSGDDSADITGAPVFVGQAVAASFIPVFADTSATGSVKIRGSNEIPVGDPGKYVPSAASFADVPNATSAIASGVGPAIVLTTMNFQYVRAVFTHSGGGTTMGTVNMTALYV